MCPARPPPQRADHRCRIVHTRRDYEPPPLSRARACRLVSDAAALSRLLRSGKLRRRCATFEVAFLQRIEIGYPKPRGPSSRNGIPVSRGLRGEAGGEMASKSTFDSADRRRRNEREDRNLERAGGKIPLPVRGRSASQGKLSHLEKERASTVKRQPDHQLGKGGQTPVSAPLLSIGRADV